MTERAVYVYMRAVTSAPERREEVLDRLQELHDEGAVDAVRTWTWANEVAQSAPHDADAVDVFEQFQRWADRREVSVQPPFRWTTRESTITGDREEVLVTPDLCLAVRDGSALVGVFPCTDGERHYGTEEALDALAEDSFPSAFDEVPSSTTYAPEESDA